MMSLSSADTDAQSNRASLSPASNSKANRPLAKTRTVQSGYIVLKYSFSLSAVSLPGGLKHNIDVLFMVFLFARFPKLGRKGRIVKFGAVIMTAVYHIADDHKSSLGNIVFLRSFCQRSHRADE